MSVNSISPEYKSRDAPQKCFAQKDEPAFLMLLLVPAADVDMKLYEVNQG
jgi:hypothetical protein